MISARRRAAASDVVSAKGMQDINVGAVKTMTADIALRFKDTMVPGCSEACQSWRTTTLFFISITGNYIYASSINASFDKLSSLD